MFSLLSKLYYLSVLFALPNSVPQLPASGGTWTKWACRFWSYVNSPPFPQLHARGLWVQGVRKQNNTFWAAGIVFICHAAQKILSETMPSGRCLVCWGFRWVLSICEHMCSSALAKQHHLIRTIVPEVPPIRLGVHHRRFRGIVNFFESRGVDEHLGFSVTARNVCIHPRGRPIWVCTCNCHCTATHPI